MKSLAEFVAVILIALVAGLAGGIGAVWSVKATSKDGCGPDPICRLGRYLNVSISNSQTSCTSADDVRAVANLVSTLLDNRPVDQFANKITVAVTPKTDRCLKLGDLTSDICAAAQGGNAGTPAACDKLGKSHNSEPLDLSLRRN